MQKVKIIGHRGFASRYPENSLIGFQKAAELGIDGIELDIHVTKDGEVVVHHDETIDRMTRGTGWIQDLTLDQLKNYPLQHGLLRRNTVERIPTLHEVLTVLGDYPHFLINIELKTNVLLYEGIERKVLEIVNSFGKKRKVLYSSFHLPTLIRLKQLQADSQTALIINRPLPHVKDYLETFAIDGVHPRKNIYFSNEQLYAQISTVRPWTVNSRREISRLLKENIAAIITKYPERALQLRSQLT